MVRTGVILMAAALMGFAGLRAGEKKDQTAEEAAKVAQLFENALWAKDLDAVLKVVDVPWYDNLLDDNMRKGRVIRDREQLKKAFAKGFEHIEAPVKVNLEVKDNFTYAQVLEKFGDQLDRDERKRWDEVLRKKDRVLNVLWSTGGRSPARGRIVIMVAFRKGQAKVVGMRDP